MSFLSSIFLFALPLAAAPVIIHLMNRRRRDVIRWGAMQLLLDSTPRKRRIWQINDLLLMIVRALAVAAIVFAFSRPQLRSGILSGNAPGRDVIFVVDSSLSTGRLVGGVPVFDEIRTRALELVNKLEDSDRVRLIVGASVPSWVTFGESNDAPATKAMVADKIAELKPTLATADIPNCVRSAIASESLPNSTSKLVIVVTDGVANGWGADAGSRWQAIKETASHAALPTAINIVTTETPSAPLANLAVEKLATNRTRVSAGEPFTLSVQLRNTGDSSTPSTTLKWEMDGEPAGESSVPQIAPGQSVDISFETSCVKTGAHAVACRAVNEDDLPGDNGSTIVVESVEKLPVLICRSDSSAVAGNSQPDFLQAAMGRSKGTGDANRAASVFEPTVVGIEELSSTDLSQYHCVILDDALPMTPEAAESLSEFVEEGGGLWVVLGEKVTAEQFNSLMYREGTGLSPVSLSERATAKGDTESDLFTVHPPEELHPATTLLGDTERLDIDDVRIKEHWKLAAPESAENTAVLLERGDGSPLAVEQIVGRGHVIVQGVPCDTAWSNLPVCQTFVPLVQEWLWYLSEPNARQFNIDPGSPIVIGSSFVPDRTELSLVTPANEKIELDLDDNQKADIRFRETTFPGDYVATAIAADKAEHQATFAVRRDAHESRLARLTSEQRGSLEEAGGIRFDTDPFLRPEKTQEVVQHQPFWSYLAALVVLLFFAEFIFSHMLTKNRYTDVPPPDDVLLAAPQGYIDTRRALATQGIATGHTQPRTPAMTAGSTKS